jgi:hypothetical protein
VFVLREIVKRELTKREIGEKYEISSVWYVEK